jgi:general stress protein 26
LPRSNREPNGDIDMTTQELLEFARRHTLAVQSSVAPDGAPQAAVVGFVVDDGLQLCFDTLASSRKCRNLRSDPRIAMVIGWSLDEGCTLQLEGLADEPTGAERERLVARYLARFPDGVERQADPDLTYFRVRPTWVRYSDFSSAEPRIVELGAAELRALAYAAGSEGATAFIGNGLRDIVSQGITRMTRTVGFHPRDRQGG